MPDELEPQVTAHGFLASPITDNIKEMDDGSLVVEDCPVARTGFQSYSVRDLPQRAASDLGIDTSNPNASIDLYRPASEVFKPEFLASLEGRPICDNHPPDFVKPETFTRYTQGHLQNVRRGTEQLDDGEWPILADLIISGEPLVSKVRARTSRENSLGYDFSIRRDGNKIVQCDMVGNHLAVVPKGRAGDDVRINDAAPPGESPPEKTLTSVAAPAARASTVNASVTKKKEHKPVKNNILHLLGLGLKAKAADSDTEPEELAQAALDVGKFQENPSDSADDRKGRDRKAKDEPDPDELDEEADDRRARDRKARDRKARDRHARDEFEEDPINQCDDRHSRDRYADDRHSRDEFSEDPTDFDHGPGEDRRVMHDALDRLLDAEDAKHGRDRRADDTDLEALKNLLSEFFTEEEAEPQHETDDADPAELEEVLGAGEQPDAEDEADPGEELEPSGEENLAEDDDEVVEEDEPMAEDRKIRDRARAADGVRATLAMLRPAVARCSDASVKRAFNTALGSLRASRANSGDYGAFVRGARALDHDRVGSRPAYLRARAADGSAEDPNTKLQKVYDDLRAKGGE